MGAQTRRRTITTRPTLAISTASRPASAIVKLSFAVDSALARISWALS